MGEFPNKATQFKSRESAVEMGRKGGLAGKNNPNVRRAAKKRWLKRKGATNQEAAYMLKLAEDPDFMDMDIIELFVKMKKRLGNKKLSTQLQSAVTVKKAVHGEPQKEGTNIQINIMQSGDVENTIKRLLNEDKTITIGDDSAEVQGSE
jgi:hypothetical protein